MLLNIILLREFIEIKLIFTDQMMILYKKKKKNLKGIQTLAYRKNKYYTAYISCRKHYLNNMKVYNHINKHSI